VRPPSRRWPRATTAHSATSWNGGGGQHGWKTAVASPGSGRSAWSRRGTGTSCSLARAVTSTRLSRSCSAEQAPLSVEQKPEFVAETVAGLSPKAKRWLAEIYQILAVTPLPGQSDLDVQPHPWLPNIYTVPFLDGHLVYVVLEWKGLVASSATTLEAAGHARTGQRSGNA
jgi:hypothetical protein